MVLPANLATGDLIDEPWTDAVTNQLTAVQALTDATFVANLDARYVNEPNPYSVGAWVIPTMQHSWVNQISIVQGARYRKIGDMVYIEGTIKNGTINTSAFTLPGFRPALIQQFAAVANGAAALLSVDDNGLVTPVSGATTNFSIACCFSVLP